MPPNACTARSSASSRASGEVTLLQARLVREQEREGDQRRREAEQRRGKTAALRLHETPGVHQVDQQVSQHDAQRDRQVDARAVPLVVVPDELADRECLPEVGGDEVG